MKTMHLFRLAVLALALLGATPGRANQSNTWSPTTGTVTGLQLTTNYNNAFSAIQSCNSGNSAPANDQTAAAVVGQCWMNTTGSPYPVQIYDGTNWDVVGWLDTTNHFWIANSGGGTGTVASATSTDLCTAKNPVQSISGTTTITGFASTCIAGTQKFLNFTGILTLTHNGTSMILPNGGSNITTAAGDTAVAVALGSGNWRVVSYQRASGVSLSTSSNFTGAVNFNAVISPTALAANTYDWNPAGLSTANVVRLSCSSATTNQIGGITAPAVEGQVLVLDNVGATNPCVLTAQDANDSTAANRFAFDRPIAIRPGRTLTIKYDATTARWVLWQEAPVQLVAGGFKNLRLLNVANALGDTAPATPNNQYKVALDEVALEDATGGVMRLQGSVNVVDYSTGSLAISAPSAYTCVADITQSGAGGLDTGLVVASTWYYVWVIAQPNGTINASAPPVTGNGAVSCMFSTQSSASLVTMPSPGGVPYTFRARVGAVQTDASSNKCLYRMQQYGRTAHYVATGANAGCSANNSFGAQVFVNTNTGSGCGTIASPSPASVTVAGNGFPLPPTAVRAAVVGNLSYKSGSGAILYVGPNSSYSGSGNGFTGGNGIQSAIDFTSQISQAPQWLTLEASTFYVCSTGGAGTAGSISDYEDNL